MKISLATNFEDDLIDKIMPFGVYEVYGRFKEDILSGGRPNNSIPEISKNKFEQHVKKVREAKINFNYLLNGACTSNLEQDKNWQSEFRNFILYLRKTGVNAFTVTNPFILILLKKIYPECVCRVSTFACVNSLQKALYWENMGADIICVDFVSANRDFALLAKMVEHLKKAKIEILVTNSCIKDCPYIHTHVNCISHASTKCKANTYIDWCLFKCQSKQLCNTEEYIKSPWVRPEDIQFYENIGIEHFKITERGFPTEILVKRLMAYKNRHYEGNLLDLIQGHGYRLEGTKEQPLNRKKDINSMSDLLEELYRVRGFNRERTMPSHCYIDNSKLQNFIQFFINNKCTGDCEKCGYCKRIANNVITENETVKNYLIELYERIEQKLFTL